MRSSVSVILSDPPPDSAMSFPDYQQTALDHQSLLIVVRPVGQQLKPRAFNKLFERISRVQQVTAREAQGGGRRSVWLRYRRCYPAENNDWGEFQSHRKVLGLITLGHVTNQVDLNDVCKQHESLRSRYASTLYDSRCVVLGMSPSGRSGPSTSASASAPPGSPAGSVGSSSGEPPAAAAALNKVSCTSLDRDSGVYDHSEPGQTSEANSEASEPPGPDSDSEPDGCIMSNNADDDNNKENSLPGPSASAATHEKNVRNDVVANSAGSDALRTPGSFRSRTLCYGSADQCDDLDAQIQEFAASLFWVLEAKRVDKSAERFDKMALLCAPFERKDFVGLDMESRSNKKRCQGRAKKQLGDLSLQTGLASEAMAYYQAAAELLKQSNDWLWLAGCFEGQCAASASILYPDLRRSQQVQRNASLNHTRVSRSGRSVVATNSLPHGIDPSEFLEASKSCLTPAEIVDKYRESVVHYSKYRHAGVIETECSLKAVHVLIEQRRYLMAAEFLQNVVFINLQLSDDEKIQRFTTLSELYAQCGFHRKAAFFRRVAAMRFVASQNPQPSWGQCYQLLLQAMDGYRLGLDPADFPSDSVSGWSALQTQLLQELVGSSRRMGNTPLAVRHLTFLLQTMFASLSDTERAEFAAQLEALAGQCQPPGPPPTPIALDSGLIIPPVYLYCLPLVRRFRPLGYLPHLRPRPLKSPKPEDSGPFIFSPLQFASLRRKRDKEKPDLQWVAGELSQVEMHVENLLPADLRVTHVALLSEGAALDAFPSTLTLAATSGAHAVHLVGAPQTPGTVSVTGYTATVLGVKSNCRLKHMDWLDVSQYAVEVVPALPQLQVSTSASKLNGPVPFDAEGSAVAANLSLFAGESHEVVLSLHNTSAHPVELLDVSLSPRPDGGAPVSFSLEELQRQLPLAPGGTASLSLTVTAGHDFVLHGDDLEAAESASISGASQAPSLLSSAPTSLPSRLSSALSSGRGQRAPGESTPSLGGGSVRSGSSGGRTTVSSAPHHRPTGGHEHRYPSKSVEAVLSVRYSGGPGLSAGLCRTFSLLVQLEVVPSLFITKWDVLPAETASTCYLVLDVLNATDQELELQYTDGKTLVMEANETCRVPVPVERCPLQPSAQEENFTTPDRQLPLGHGLAAVSSHCDVTEHVTRRVTLGWRAGERRGTADLRGVTWSAAMLEALRMSPVRWDISINGDPVDAAAGDCQHRLGDVVRAQVRLVNCSQSTLSSLHLRAAVYQDQQNGALTYRLENKVAVSGALGCSVEVVPPGEAMRHEVGLVFFAAGKYTLQLVCATEGAESWTCLQPLNVV